MWDLDAIIRSNNQAAIDYMMRGRKVDIAQSPQPQAWSLSLLAEKLKVGPPLLSKLLDSFTDIDTLEKFLGLIREYLPEHEEEILSSGTRKVYRFCYLFSKSYFPLPPYASQAEVSGLVSCLPVELMAMSHSAYHDLEMRWGYLLLLSLVIYPYEGDWRDEEDDEVPFDPIEQYVMGLPTEKYKPSASDITWVKSLVATLAVDGQWIAPIGFTMVKVADNKIVLREAIDTPEVRETIRRTLLIAEKAGIEAAFTRTGRTSQEKLNGARVPLLEVVQRHVGIEVADFIPAGGWTPSELHAMTDGTSYEGVGIFADWACSITNCVVLDSGYDRCNYIEGYSEPIFKWTSFNVDILTKEWPKVQEIRQKIDHVVEWLEADPISHFRELLEFMAANPAPKQEKTVKEISDYDPTEHFCPLDQLGEEEEDEEDE